MRELCDRHDIVLIYDEIITGFGRTGKLFAAEHWNAWPDIFCLGKGISGGYAPLSANLLTTRIGEVFYGAAVDQVQFHAGHTFGGNPVASAVGIAAIRQILDEGIVENSRARGAQAQARLRELQRRLPVIGDVRGEGLLIGVEFVRDPATRERFPADVNFGIRVREAARRRGPAPAREPLDGRVRAAAHDHGGRGGRAPGHLRGGARGRAGKRGAPERTLASGVVGRVSA